MKPLSFLEKHIVLLLVDLFSQEPNQYIWAVIFDERWGIPLGVSLENAIKSMDAHPEAKAILLVYPNYYGVGIDIVNIIQEAHKRELIVLVDEAHGPHLPFSESLPIEATEAGADLVAQSTHKSVGSLTQTSWLLGQGKKIDKRRITQMHQMLQSTSPNYIFLASLDRRAIN